MRELKRESHVAIAGQDCIQEAIEEMRNPRSPLIASVSHEAATYGPRVIQLGLALLSGQTVPPYNFVEHKLVAAASLAAEMSGNNGKSRRKDSGNSSRVSVRQKRATR